MRGSAGSSDGDTSHRILVVDDESVIREFVRTALEGPGVDVVEAADGEAAVKRLLREPFDVIVADKNLPGTTGLEVIRCAKALDPTIATLVITGYASAESAEEALAMGVDDYLIKPFDIADLVAKVGEARQRRAVRRQVGGEQKAPQAVRRIMVCEPNGADRRLLLRAVEILGHRPIAAEALSGVLAAVRQEQVEGVICSLELLDREDATACFLRSRLILSPGVRFVVVAQRHDTEEVVQALRRGAGKAIFQPLTSAEAVADSLREFLKASARPRAGT